MMVPVLEDRVSVTAVGDTLATLEDTVDDAMIPGVLLNGVGKV